MKKSQKMLAGLTPASRFKLTAQMFGGSDGF
jgi:hypothetical protein